MTKLWTHWHRRAAAVTAVFACALLGGCESMSALIQPPSVQLAGLTLHSAGIAAQRFEVVLNVTNPNVVPLPVERVAFSVRVAGGGVMNGATAERFTLGAGDTETVRVNVDTNLVSSVSRLLALLQGPTSTVPYDLDGSVTVSRGIGRAFPFSHRGEIPLSMPQAR